MKTIKQIIGEAVGEASMCWTPRPSTEVFNSEEALKIVDATCQAINEILEGVVAEVAKKPAISPRVGAFVGKSITNSGPTAQARIDGFNCALSEIRTNAAKVLGE